MRKILLFITAMLVVGLVRDVRSQVGITSTQESELGKIKENMSGLRTPVKFHNLAQFKSTNGCARGDAGKDCRLQNTRKVHAAVDKFLEGKLGGIQVGKTQKRDVDRIFEPVQPLVDRSLEPASFKSFYIVCTQAPIEHAVPSLGYVKFNLHGVEMVFRGEDGLVTSIRLVDENKEFVNNPCL